MESQGGPHLVWLDFLSLFSLHLDGVLNELCSPTQYLQDFVIKTLPLQQTIHQLQTAHCGFLLPK